MARGSSLKRKTLTLTKKRNAKDQLEILSEDENGKLKLDSTNENSKSIEKEKGLRKVGTKHLVYHREKFPCTNFKC